jgi:hypothetical protein
MSSAAALTQLARRAAAMATGPTAEAERALGRVSIDGSLYGLGARALFVYSASQPRAMSLTTAALGGGSHAPTSSDAAAGAFVEDLFRRGRVHLGARRVALAGGAGPAGSLKTHKLVFEGGATVLRRRLFDCGHVEV